ncbi:RagB/SusD family nutrient uptake outer membrane protein [Alloprevotella sp. OH1205_COT-284]|uniref:RagB/SusD family nutrient uptake outer membrane protein n=1 Tax=Alloprevotella sp. OH1205_COT-284 TaxID=2491043 RepID=UPI000F5F6648|nr:RagB/SusD family nutrient uptake outer membrane protein [Alloprevotella sp. OH1205_COT-284]RRD80567.1 RagB/SusD family nutrient uptake outer membrane protein [Alloprevotella sp. OH1205_COT-284]
MKRTFINKLLIPVAAIVMGGFVSCEDFLTLYPTDSITKEEFWNTSNDVNNVRAAAYYQLTENTGKILTWGEFRSDNVTLNDMKQTKYRYLQEAVLQPTENMFDWSSMYKGINFCNEVLENGQTMFDRGVDPSFTGRDWNSIKAEMTALRALYYFYLVRAYRNVPYVTHAVSTDVEAQASRVAATSGQVIMDSLITGLERVLDAKYATFSYGTQAENKGRWTDRSIRALLADMCLWRAGMVMKATEKAKSFNDKRFYVTNQQGDTLTAAQENDLSAQLLIKAHDYASSVIAEIHKDYIIYLDRNNVDRESDERKQPFPMIRNLVFAFGTPDLAYFDVFGKKNSIETILELQFDGVNTKNKALTDFFYGNPEGAYRAGTMVANPQLFSVATSVDPAKGYGKTDLRFLSYGKYTPGSISNVTPIIKGVATSISALNPANVMLGYMEDSYRAANSQNGNWPLYRLADMMMIKAEAIARLREEPINNPNYSDTEAYLLANELFRRNNPACDTVNTSSTEFCVRLRRKSLDGDDAAANIKARYGHYSGLKHLIFCERQREFIGEGKRWFDIVRECEFRGATKDVLNDWVGSSSVVRNRLRTIWSLYNPIYNEELKVNGVGFGNGDGKLLQNPTWEKYMPKK